MMLRDEASMLPGEIITFYSYKGGTGRSMALANIAYLLAKDEDTRQDKGVLAIDWDLEAPGLHRYFGEFLTKTVKKQQDAEQILNDCPGLIDLILELDALIPQTDDPYKGQTEDEARSTLEQIDLNSFILSTNRAGLYFLKAGRFDESYAVRVNTFNWESLYIRSPRLMRVIAATLAERFQYVLIDSRTGITDISNICTMLLPEKLVLVFTPNRQSLTGLQHLIKQAVEYRTQSEDLRPLMIFPLPSRIDVSMPKLEKIWRHGDEEKQLHGYQPLFEETFQQVYSLDDCDLEPYFNEVKIQHVADYAYGEEIAAILERDGVDRLSLTRSYQNFLKRLIQLAAPWEDREIIEEQSDSFRQSVQKNAPFKSRILFLAATPKDLPRLRVDEEVRAIQQALWQSSLRDEIELQQLWAVRIPGLQQYLLQYQPEIIHFSGHGLKDGIFIEDDSGKSYLVSGTDLIQLFSVSKDNLRCVILNTSFSDVIAKTLIASIDSAIGFPSDIGDRVAISFTTAFYQALALGRDIQAAFNFGYTSIIKLHDLPDEYGPILFTKPGINPASIYLMTKVNLR